MRKLALALAAVTAFTAPTQAATVFSDNFDGENGGNSALNYTGFANFSVNGQVDIVKSGDYGITCSGVCVDLDGSSGPGEIDSGIFAFNAGDILTLTFDIGGSQRGGTDSWYAGFGTTFGVFTTSGVVNSSDPFTTQVFSWTAPGAGQAFFGFGTSSGDNIGPLLDNVSLDITAVPEPGTWAMMIGGFALAGAAMRRRKAAVSFA